MNINEAISHAREVAENQREDNENCKYKAEYGCKGCADYYSKPCNECAEEHEQLVEWLEELKSYREIGTVEECRAAVEKQKAKKPDYDDYHRAGYRCPDCNNVNPWGYKHCKHCGQKLDWSDEE